MFIVYDYIILVSSIHYFFFRSTVRHLLVAD